MSNTLKKRVSELYLQVGLNNIFTAIIATQVSHADGFTASAVIGVVTCFAIWRLNTAESAK